MGTKHFDDFMFVSASTVQRFLISSICLACLHQKKSDCNDLKSHYSFHVISVICIYNNIIMSQELIKLFSPHAAQFSHTIIIVNFKVLSWRAAFLLLSRTRFANRRPRVTDALAEKRGFKRFSFFGKASTVQFIQPFAAARAHQLPVSRERAFTLLKDSQP